MRLDEPTTPDPQPDAEQAQGENQDQADTAAAEQAHDAAETSQDSGE